MTTSTRELPVLLIARHATPDRSRREIPYRLPPGPPLAAQGEAEAAELGVFLAAAGVVAIYTSPFERARQTADIAARAAGLSPRIEPALGEWMVEETTADVRARAWPFWERASAESLGSGPIAFVSHGGPIGFLLEEAGLSRELLADYKRRFDKGNPLPPAGVWMARRPHGGSGWKLEFAFEPKPPSPVDSRLS